MKKIIEFLNSLLPKREGYENKKCYGKNCYNSNGEFLEYCKYDGR